MGEWERHLCLFGTSPPLTEDVQTCLLRNACKSLLFPLLLITAAPTTITTEGTLVSPRVANVALAGFALLPHSLFLAQNC